MKDDLAGVLEFDVPAEETTEAFVVPETTAIAEAPQRQMAVADDVTPMALIQVAMESGADLDRLERLMEMQMRWEESAARKAFNKAVADLKKESIVIVKDALVDFQTTKGRTRYRHETLGNVLSQVTEAMSRYGLSHSWDISQQGGNISVTCVLSHELGHSKPTSMSAPADNSGGKNQIQQIGSAVTYLQRYTLKAALGLASQDYDGRDPAPGSENDHINGCIDKNQMANIEALILEVGITEDAVCQFFKIGCLEELKDSDYERAIAKLEKTRGK